MSKRNEIGWLVEETRVCFLSRQYETEKNILILSPSTGSNDGRMKKNVEIKKIGINFSFFLALVFPPQNNAHATTTKYSVHITWCNS